MGGVQPGWQVIQIDGLPYVNDMVEQKKEGTMQYSMTFIQDPMKEMVHQRPPTQQRMALEQMQHQRARPRITARNGEQQYRQQENLAPLKISTFAAAANCCGCGPCLGVGLWYRFKDAPLGS